MGEGSKKEVYNVPVKRELIHGIDCCPARNAARANPNTVRE
jgi:hypothetical protein